MLFIVSIIIIIIIVVTTLFILTQGNMHIIQTIPYTCVNWIIRPQVRRCLVVLVIFFLAELCQLAKDAGPCFDSMLRFYWSRDDAECRPFTYGGCGGNDNRFTTAEECYSRCSSTNHHQRRTYSPADCFQPVTEGHCDETEIRWFFDAEREDCLAFYYSGCGSNGNNFRDYEDCYAFCSAGTCLLYTSPSPRD